MTAHMTAHLQCHLKNGMILRPAPAGEPGADLACSLQASIEEHALAKIEIRGGAGTFAETGVSPQALGLRISARARLRPRAASGEIRWVLLEALGVREQAHRGLAGRDQQITRALRSDFRVLICDCVQQLSEETRGYLEWLWVQATTPMALILIRGGSHAPEPGNGRTHPGLTGPELLVLSAARPHATGDARLQGARRAS